MLLLLAALAGGVALDVGHSLAAPGAVAASGRTEFSYNQALARRVGAELKQRGIGYGFVGMDGKMTHLGDRDLAARDARLFISLHHDSVQPQLLAQVGQYTGFSLFISRENPYWQQSLGCARLIADQLLASGRHPSLHHAAAIAGENRPLADAARGIYFYDGLAVARHARQAAVLIESAIIVNPAEEAYIASPAGQTATAGAIARGIQGCLALPGLDESE